MNSTSTTNIFYNNISFIVIIFTAPLLWCLVTFFFYCCRFCYEFFHYSPYFHDDSESYSESEDVNIDDILVLQQMVSERHHRNLQDRVNREVNLSKLEAGELITCSNSKSDEEVISSSTEKSDESTCVICLSKIRGDQGERNAIKIQCGHIFHYQCLKNWQKTLHNTCPICRLPINS